MSKPKGTKNKLKGYALEHPENMISSGAAYELANSFKNEAELYKRKFEQSEKERDHYKALHDALYKWQIEINDYDFNDRQGYEDAVVIAFNNYQSLKTQTP